MKYIFSPSKGMSYNKNFKIQNLENSTIIFNEKTELILKKIQNFDLESFEKIFKIKNQLLLDTYQNYKNYENLESKEAILLYDGVSFKELNIYDYTEEEINFLKKNVFILSAFYGVSNALTKIKPYRLDMGHKILDISLYKYWGKEISDFFKNEMIVNIASNEFSKMIPKNQLLNIVFKKIKNGKLVSLSSSEGKTMRGKYLNFVIQNQISNIDSLKNFSENGYIFSEENSDKHNICFLKK